MRITRQDRLLDYPLIEVRDFLRQYRYRLFDIAAIRRARKCSTRAARRLAIAMEQTRYTCRAQPEMDVWHWAWSTTEIGLRLAKASAAQRWRRAFWTPDGACFAPCSRTKPIGRIAT